MRDVLPCVSAPCAAGLAALRPGLLRQAVRRRAVLDSGSSSHVRHEGQFTATPLYDKGYLIVDGTDGKAHYVALPLRSELEPYPTGAVVEVKGSTDVRAVGRVT